MMGEPPELAMFRRDAALDAQNILEQQAELSRSERKSRRFADVEDERSGERGKERLLSRLFRTRYK